MRNSLHIKVTQSRTQSARSRMY